MKSQKKFYFTVKWAIRKKEKQKRTSVIVEKNERSKERTISQKRKQARAIWTVVTIKIGL